MIIKESLSIVTNLFPHNSQFLRLIGITNCDKIIDFVTVSMGWECFCSIIILSMLEKLSLFLLVMTSYGCLFTLSLNQQILSSWYVFICSTI